MSQAEELLETLTSDSEDISAYIAGSEDEEHIIIDENRIVNVPNSLRRIAVQYDHNVETVTFDCPRYWDERDLSSMHIYINYSLPSGTKGRYLTKDLRVDETDENIIHFDWVITNEFTYESGGISFLICAVQTDSEGNEEVHWNTEINNQLTVSRGMECSEIIPEAYPDIINDIFTRLDTVIADNDEIIENNETIIQNNANLTTQLNDVLESNTKLTNQAQAAVDSHNELAERITYVSDNMEEYVNASVAEANADLSEDFYYLKNDVLETGEASGSFINAKDTTLARLQRIKIKGPGKQFTTTGKNKLNTSKQLQETVYLGVTFTPIYQGNLLMGVKLNGTAGSWMSFGINEESFTLPAGTYVQSMHKEGSFSNGSVYIDSEFGSSSIENINSKTLEADLTITKFRICVNTGTVCNNLILRPMIEEGTQITEYEPYTGGQASPNPSYPQEHKVIDEYNIFDKDNADTLAGYINNANGLLQSDTNARSFYVKCESNTLYTITKVKSNRFMVGSINTVPSLGLTLQKVVTVNSNKTLEYVTTDDAKYLVVYYYSSVYDTLSEEEIRATICVVKGKTDKKYAPYKAIPLVITGENLLDLSMINGNYTGVEITTDEDGYKVLNGSLNYDYAIIYDFGSPHYLKHGKTYTIANDFYPSPIYAQILMKDKLTGQNTYIYSQTGPKTFTVNKEKYDYTLTLQFGTKNAVGTLENFKNKFGLFVGTEVLNVADYTEQRMYYPIPDGEFFGGIGETDADEFVTEFNEKYGKFHNYLDKNVVEYVFTGDEEFSKADPTNTVSSFFTRAITNKKAGHNNFKCNYFVYKGNAQHTPNLGYAVSFNGMEEYKDYMYIQVPSNVVAPGDEEGFKTWFKNTFPSEKPLKVRYSLAKPYRIDLGPVDMPISQDSETNVFSTHELSPETTITYHKNFKKTIENMQVNEKALKQELIDLNTRLSALETSVASIGSEVVE